MSTPREFVHKVSKTATIKRSFLGTSYPIIYAGMPSESVYSVVATSTSGYQTIANNLFLPVERTGVQLPTGFLMAHGATAGELRFSLGY